MLGFFYKKHNVNTTRQRFPIEIYMGGPPYKPYFIVLMLQGKIIIRSTKKMVASYVVEDLALFVRVVKSGLCFILFLFSIFFFFLIYFSSFELRIRILV